MCHLCGAKRQPNKWFRARCERAHPVYLDGFCLAYFLPVLFIATLGACQLIRVAYQVLHFFPS